MYVTGPNVQQQALQPNQSNTGSYCCVPVAQSQPAQPVSQFPNNNNIPPQPVVTQTPQACNPPVQVPCAQAAVAPSCTSGVNIQIFNPSIATPGSMPPTYNVNAPCYPSNYYTNQYGPGGQNPADGCCGCKPQDEKPKMEKRKIVQLTDDYIKNLENYLDCQDKEVRVGAAKEVFARLEEDDSRKDDKALTALINKMLQDPSQAVRFLALAALDDRIVLGDDFTATILKNMQQSPKGNRQDAVDAARILMKMSGKEVEKEFPERQKSEKDKDKKPTFKV